ncbi:hypothetical protein DIPPA_18536 [Diplonema papillatum]|nr:hypothetical protein DIPPA_18536 [Diplonema papillatum]
MGPKKVHDIRGLQKLGSFFRSANVPVREVVLPTEGVSTVYENWTATDFKTEDPVCTDLAGFVRRQVGLRDLTVDITELHVQIDICRTYDRLLDEDNRRDAHLRTTVRTLKARAIGAAQRVNSILVTAVAAAVSVLPVARSGSVRQTASYSESVSFEYEKWTPNTFRQLDKDGAPDFGGFLVRQLRHRGFKSIQNQKNRVCMTLARLFDELVSEDDKRAEQLRKPLADLRSEALRLVGARQVVLVSCVSCLAAACACIASSSGSVPPVPIAPSTQTAAAPFVDERIRKLVDEVEKDYNEEEERTSLEKNVQGSRKRKRSETVVFNRELWNAPCPFPTMLTHEVQALCDLSVPVFDQHNFEFPTAVELKKVGRVINTQNFVAICHHIMAAAHHDRSIVRFTQEQQERAALHDQGTRDLLQNAFNLTSDEVINEIFSIMVAHTQTLTRQKIQGSRYVSFMTDECQDLKKRAQYAVFFKVLEGGLITEVFWDLQAKKSADGSAPELFKHLVKMTDALKGVWSKVVGVSTDGANVMKGHLSGTQLLLRSRLCPYALWIWCQGHKLNVLCLRVGKAYADIADVEVFLSAVYRLFYRGRGDGKGKLRTLNECVSAAAKAVDNFGMWRELELCEVGDTRWVSHERAASTVTNVLRGVYQGVSALSEGNEAAREVSEHMQKKGPMFALFLYEVTLPVVAHFSSALQKASSFFAQVVSLKGHYKKKILDIAHEPKQYTKYFNCHMVLNAATTGIFQQPWATHEELTTWHHSVAVPYLKALAKAFDEELGMSACLQAFSLYDPKGPTFANGKIDLVAAKKELGHILAHYSGPHTFKNCSEEM